MRLIDEQYTWVPFFGARRMAVWLREQGYEVNRKRVARLMTVMGIEAVYPKRNLNRPAEGHRIYRYLLEGVASSASTRFGARTSTTSGWRTVSCTWWR